MTGKILKKWLSVLLCLTLVVTSFCIFDPSLIGLGTSAYTNVDGIDPTDTMPNLVAAAPESIYMAEGTNTFSKYLNHEARSGSVVEAVSSSGEVYFEYSTASSIILKVNDVYYYDKAVDGSYSTTATKAAGNSLKINSVKIKEPCSISVSTAGVLGNTSNLTSAESESPVLATSSNGKLSFKINNGSFDTSGFDATPPQVIYVEWVVGYNVDGAWHYSFMYTAVYWPEVAQAGMISDTAYQGLAVENRNITYSFITGVQAITGGNRKSNFIKIKKSGLYSPSDLIAPLHAFVGEAQNKNSYTIPGGAQAAYDTAYFSSITNGGVFNHGSKVIEYKGSSTWAPFEFGISESSSTYARNAGNIPSILGSMKLVNGNSMVTSNSYKPGVGFITIDTSRFENYSQVPNLSVGWAQLYHQNDTNGNSLTKIEVCDNDPIDAKGWITGETDYASERAVTVDVDSSDFEGGDNVSNVRGLYKLNGQITADNPTLKIYFGSESGYKSASGTVETNYTASFVGLKVFSTDKSELRQLCYTADCSNVDRGYLVAAGGSAADYYSYYAQKKSANEKLCNPLDSTASDNSFKTTLDSQIATIKENSTNNIYFYVPEAIYTKPYLATVSAAHYGALYVDGKVNTTTHQLTLTSGEQTYGNIYFYYKDAKDLKISFEVVGTSSNSNANNTITYAPSAANTTGTTITNTNAQSNSAISASGNTFFQYIISSKAYLSASEKGSWFKWTASYTDKKDGVQKSVNAYTYIYKTNYLPVAAASRMENDRGDNSFASTATWISGIHNVTAQTTSANYSSMMYTRVNDGKYFVPYSYQKQMAYHNNMTTSLDTSLGELVSSYRYAFSNTDPLLYFTAPGTNDGVIDWLHSSAGTYNSVQNALLVSRTCGSNTGDSYNITWSNSPTADITIDTSRYSNLNEIPGLTAGMMVTDDEGSNSGTWYVSNYTTCYYANGSGATYDKGDTGKDRIKTYFSYKGDLISGFADLNLVSGRELEGVKFNGKWAAAIDKSVSSKVYSFKGLYVNSDSDWICNSMVCYMNALQYNKANLRQQYQRAINLGNFIDTKFYNTSSAEWKAYEAAFEAAAKGLTQVDGTLSASPDTLANNLKNALDKVLVSEGRATSTVTVYHKFLNVDGTVNTAVQTKTETAVYKYGDDVRTGANDYKGYSCVGYYNGNWSYGNAYHYEGDSTVENSYRAASSNTVYSVHQPALTYTYLYKPEYYLAKLDYAGGSLAGDNETNLLSALSSFNQSWSSGADTQGGSFDYSYSGLNDGLSITTTAASSGNYYSLSMPQEIVLQANTTYTFSAKATLEWNDSDYFGNKWTGLKENERARVYLLASESQEKIELDLSSFDECSFTTGSEAEYTLVFEVLSAYSGTECTFSQISLTKQLKTAAPATLSTSAGVVLGSSYTLPTPTRDGYTFTGWKIVNGEGTLSADNSLTWTAGASNDTIRATWSRNHYDVTYDNYIAFDEWSQAIEGAGGAVVKKDTDSNSITIKSSGAQGDAVNCYTTPYNAAYGLELEDGHIYELSYKVESISSSFDFAPSIFTYSTEIGTDYGRILEIEGSDAAAAKAQNPRGFSSSYTRGFGTDYELSPADDGTYKGSDKYYFYVTEERPFVNFSFALKSGATTVKISEIMIRDVTNSLGEADDITMPYVELTNGVKLTMKSSQAYYGTALGENDDTAAGLPVAQRVGYTFTGWNTKPDGTGTVCTTSSPLMAERTLQVFSQWEINSYTISFEAQNAEVLPPPTQSRTYKSALGELPELEADGYTFDGWYYSSDYSVKAKASDEITGNTVLYAKWNAHQFSIIYNSNGGTGSPDRQTLTYGESSTISSLTMVKTGWSFLGWNTSPTADTALYLNGQFLSAQAVENIYYIVGNGGTYTLYAIWEINSYTVTINPNGGTCAGFIYAKQDGSTHTQGSFSSAHNETVEYSTSLLIKPPTRTGYTFTGWSLNASPANASYSYGGTSADSVYTVGTGNVTLTASWSLNVYNIRVNPNGGSVANLSYTNAEGDVVTSTMINMETSFSVNYQTTMTLPVPTRTGYTFVEWISYNSPADSELISNADANSTYKIGSGNALITAIWATNSYTVTVNPNGAAIGTINYTNAQGQTATVNNVTQSTDIEMQYASVASISLPTKTGYIFTGWSKTSGAGTISNSTSSASTFTVGAGNASIIANWSVASYKITINPTGGVIPSVIYTDYKGSVTTANSVLISTAFNSMYATDITIGIPTRTGYAFVGWSAAENPEGSDFVNNATTSPSVYKVGAGDDTITAQWQISAYSVTINPNSGTVPSVSFINVSQEQDTQAAFNSSTVITSLYSMTMTIEKPTRTGYTFTGWSASSTPQNAVLVSSLTGDSTYTFGAGNTTLTAGWSVDKFNVKLDSRTTGGATADQTLSATYGTSLSLSSLITPVRTGFTFNGWSTVSTNGVGGTDGKIAGSVVDEETINQWYAQVGKNSTKTLYALWSANTSTLTVYYFKKGSLTYSNTVSSGFGVSVGESSYAASASGQVNYGEIVENLFDYKAETGYKLSAWRYSTSAPGAVLTASWGTAGLSSLTMPENKLYVVCLFDVDTVTINLDMCGGSGGTTSVSVAKGSVMPQITIPVYTGYTFDGYYSSVNGTGKQYYTSTGSSEVLCDLDSGATLYANWVGVNAYFRANADSTCVIDGNYIYGLKTRLSASQLRGTYLDYENVTLTIEGVTGRYLGTGSTVTVEYPDGTVEVYTIIIYGDVTGDSEITSDDVTELNAYIAKVNTNLDASQLKAANIDGSRRVDSDDVNTIKQAVEGIIEINQADPTL